jgi:hypothetical protein
MGSNQQTTTDDGIHRCPAETLEDEEMMNDFDAPGTSQQQQPSGSSSQYYRQQFRNQQQRLVSSGNGTEHLAMGTLGGQLEYQLLPQQPGPSSSPANVDLQLMDVVQQLNGSESEPDPGDDEDAFEGEPRPHLNGHNGLPASSAAAEKSKKEVSK